MWIAGFEYIIQSTKALQTIMKTEQDAKEIAELDREVAQANKRKKRERRMQSIQKQEDESVEDPETKRSQL
jgi:hypothetical protein